MPALGSVRLAVRVCQMHYLENLSQKEISAELGISRPQICRILSTAKKDKLVSITINDPNTEESSLQNALRDHYPVGDVLVFDTSKEVLGPSLANFGRMAAQCLDIYIGDTSFVGVMGGQTVQSLVQGLCSFSRRGIKVVPLVGGIGAVKAEWQANSVAQTLAERSGGSSYVLNAPIIVRSKEARKIIMSEPEISDVLQLGAKCKTVLVGIGTQDSAAAILAGGLTKMDIEELKQQGVTGAVCVSFLDKEGKILDVPLARRAIGQTLTSLKGARIIALAIGEQKLPAIHSALSSGYIDVFMTDMQTAEKLVEVRNIPVPIRTQSWL